VQWALAIVAAAAVALVIGAVSVRTSGVYFIMITLAFTQMLYYLGISVETYGGDDGMRLAEAVFTADSQAAAGILALAAILATVLVRPPEHPLAARLLSLVRAFAVVPLAMLFLAGVALMLVPEWLSHPWVSIAGFALAAAGALVVVVGWLLARSPDPGRLPSQHAEGPNAAREEERARAELARSNEWNLPDVGAAGSSEGDRYVFYLPPEHHAVGVEVRWTDADQRGLESRLARLKRRL
jgi:hypothetical protein